MISATEGIVGHALMFHLMNYHVSVEHKLIFHQFIVELNLLNVTILVREIMNVLTRSGKNSYFYMGLFTLLLIISINVLLTENKITFQAYMSQ